MRAKKFILLILVGGLWSACSTIKVQTNYDPEYPFSGLKTFGFVIPLAPKGRVRITPGLIRRPHFNESVKKEIATVLERKGFWSAPRRHRADFLVTFYAVAKNKVAISPASYRIGRFGRRWVRAGKVHHYKQGTLIIDIIDPGKKELIFRAVGTGILDRSNPSRNLLEAVDKILREFPPAQ